MRLALLCTLACSGLRQGQVERLAPSQAKFPHVSHAVILPGAIQVRRCCLFSWRLLLTAVHVVAQLQHTIDAGAGCTWADALMGLGLGPSSPSTAIESGAVA